MPLQAAACFFTAASMFFCVASVSSISVVLAFLTPRFLKCSSSSLSLRSLPENELTFLSAQVRTPATTTCVSSGSRTGWAAAGSASTATTRDTRATSRMARS